MGAAGSVSKRPSLRLESFCLPLALQTMLCAIPSLVDGVMVGPLGKAALASVGIAGQVQLVVWMCLNGISGSTSMFVSQLRGLGNRRTIEQAAHTSMVLSLALSGVFSLACITFSTPIMDLFSSDAGVIRLGGAYLQFAAPSYVLMAFSMCCSTLVRSMGVVRLPLLATQVGLAVNVCSNYILVYGAWGAPKMGVQGAALGTLLSRCIEAACFLPPIFTTKSGLPRLPSLTLFSSALYTPLVRHATVLIVKDGGWALATAMYMMIYARMGTAVAAAANIQYAVQALTVSILVGIAFGAQVLIGVELGAARVTCAFALARKFLLVFVVMTLVMSLCILAGGGRIISLYDAEQSVGDLAHIFLSYGALLLPVTGLAPFFTLGVLRAGGDNAYVTKVDLLSMYAFGLPLTALLGLVLELPLYIVLLGFVGQELLKLVLFCIRYRSGVWARNIVG